MIPGPMELILILLIVVLLFGAKRIPEIMGGLGKGTRGFRKSLEGADTEVTAVVDIRKERIEPK